MQERTAEAYNFAVRRPGAVDLSDEACLKCQTFSVRKKARGNHFLFTEK